MSVLREDLRQYQQELKTMPSTSLVKVDVAFELSWHYYPLKIGKKKARGHFNATVKTKHDWSRHVQAFNKYLEHVQTERVNGNPRLKWQYGSTWFNQWEDWAVMAEEE